MQLYKERMMIRLRTDYIKEHCLENYPERWIVKSVVVREPQMEGTPTLFRSADWYIHELTEMRTDPIHLVIYQPRQRRYGPGNDYMESILSDQTIVVRPGDCIVDDELLDQVDELKPWELGLASPVNIERDHIKEVLLGNTGWWEKEYDKMIEGEKIRFKERTGLDYELYDDDKYGEFLSRTVQNFIDMINKDFKKKTGKELYIRTNPLFGGWVTTDSDSYNKEGWIESLEIFWECYIRHNEIHPDDIKSFYYRVDGPDDKKFDYWKKFDLTKYFKNYETY